jgi:Ser/Thr protein kinase RdoA (MazF antagonist)
MMNESTIIKAAVQFGKGVPTLEILGNGLIHQTYKVSYTEDRSVVLQCINQATFSRPENIINNYRLVQNHLNNSNAAVRVADLLLTRQGKHFWIDGDNNFWRATEFIENSYTLSIPSNSEQVYTVAKCFAGFTSALSGLNAEHFDIIIPNFHDLRFRYDQFEHAIATAGINRLLKATHVISELRDRFHLVQFYEEIAADAKNYPLRVMHHDCKISNILFDRTTGKALFPVDLDTVMPGKFFSDIGDMIRTMACTVDENSAAWEQIAINKEYYDAILRGYEEGMKGGLTEKEKQGLYKAGNMLMYMQALRFVTDFLQNDVYYKTSYPEQNLNRALNQLLLLERTEELIPQNS